MAKSEEEIRTWLSALELSPEEIKHNVAIWKTAQEKTAQEEQDEMDDVLVRRLQRLADEAYAEKEGQEERQMMTNLLMAQAFQMQADEEQAQHMASQEMASVLEAENDKTHKAADIDFEVFNSTLQRIAQTSQGSLELYLNQVRSIVISEAVKGSYTPGVQAGPLMNAHTFTTTFIRQQTPILIQIDAQLQLSDPTLSVAALQKEVKETMNGRCTFPLSAATNVQTTLNKLEESLRLTPNGIEAETQVHALQLLSRVWSLATKMGISYQGKIIACLSDNIGDSGGCIAGLVARLYPCYARMLEDVLQSAVNQYAGFVERKVSTP